MNRIIFICIEVRIMAFTLQLDQWIYLICFGILYLGFLGYDLFKRGEKYGYIAYFIALLPANYLWYCVTLPLTRPLLRTRFLFWSDGIHGFVSGIVDSLRPTRYSNQK